MMKQWRTANRHTILRKQRSFSLCSALVKNGAVAAVHKESGKMMGYILFSKFDEGVYEMGWIYN